MSIKNKESRYGWYLSITVIIRATPKDFLYLTSVTITDFGEKIPYNSFYNWLSKYSHPLFWISC
jgi:hypothetical protein